jgi:hypothetical protein
MVSVSSNPSSPIRIVILFLNREGEYHRSKGVKRYKKIFFKYKETNANPE